jgi:hypothetical protein
MTFLAKIDFGRRVEVEGRAPPQNATGGAERESTLQGPPSESLRQQYPLAKTLGIWAVAALPMGLLTRVIGPTIIPHTSRFTPVVVPEGRLASNRT